MNLIDEVQSGDVVAMRRLLAHAWMEQHPNEDRPHATQESRVRHSWASKCMRALRYNIEGVKPSNPLSINTYWTFRIGQLTHDEWQAALENLTTEDVKVELEAGYANPEAQASGSLDAVLTFGEASGAPTTQAVEIKSINGFGYKAMLGVRGSAEGPRTSAVTQLALNAHALNMTGTCTGGWLIVVSLENISPKEAERHQLDTLDRFMKVYWYPINVLEPIALAEMARFNDVLLDVDEEARLHKLDSLTTPVEWKVHTPRSIPSIPHDAVITDPSKGTWQVRNAEGAVLDVGSTWECAYCDHRATCIEEGE